MIKRTAHIFYCVAPQVFYYPLTRRKFIFFQGRQPMEWQGQSNPSQELQVQKDGTGLLREDRLESSKDGSQLPPSSLATLEPSMPSPLQERRLLLTTPPQSPDKIPPPLRRSPRLNRISDQDFLQSMLNSPLSDLAPPDPNQDPGSYGSNASRSSGRGRKRPTKTGEREWIGQQPPPHPPH